MQEISGFSCGPFLRFREVSVWFYGELWRPPRQQKRSENGPKAEKTKIKFSLKRDGFTGDEWNWKKIIISAKKILSGQIKNSALADHWWENFLSKNRKNAGSLPNIVQNPPPFFPGETDSDPGSATAFLSSWSPRTTYSVPAPGRDYIRPCLEAAEAAVKSSAAVAGDTTRGGREKP